MLPKKVVKIICIVLAALMALSAVAALTAVFASDSADSAVALHHADSSIIQNVLDYSGVAALAGLAVLGVVLCVALPKVKNKNVQRVRFSSGKDN